MSEIAVPDYDDLLLDELDLASPAQVNRSQWTGTRKVVGMPGVELWTGKATIADLATEEAERPWRARQVANDGLVGNRLGQGRGVLGPSWSQQ